MKGRSYMRIEGDKLKVISELYASALSASEEARSEFFKYRAQYSGDDTVDGSAQRAAFVRNITYEIIEAQVSTVIPKAKVEAGIYSPESERRATVIERICDKLRNKIDFERINDLTERDTTVTGASVYLVEWDDRASGQHGARGDVCISAVAPEDLIPQPGRYRVCDMDYCFIRSRTTRRDVCERYGVSCGLALSLETSDDRLDADGETVELVTCFYYDADGRLSKFIFSGDTVLEDIENYYARKSRICSRCGQSERHCRCEKPSFKLVDEECEHVRASLLPPNVRDDGGAAEDDTCVDIPWYIPREMPIVIRTNITRSDRWYGQSDCEFIRPYQQELNKLESRIHSKLISSSVIPVLPADSELRLDNSINTRVLRLREGEDRGQYGVIDTSVDITQELRNAERVYDMAKRAMGITASFQGQSDDTAISGKAKQIQVDQSAGRMASKRVMKQVAFAEMDRLIFELYLAYADEPRGVSYTDAFGRTQTDSFDRYSFIKRDAASGEYYYDDNYLFSADDTNELETERKRLSEECVEFFKNGIFGDCSDARSVQRFWQCLERLKHPLGRFNAEFYKVAASLAADAVDVGASDAGDICTERG